MHNKYMFLVFAKMSFTDTVVNVMLHSDVTNVCGQFDSELN